MGPLDFAGNPFVSVAIGFFFGIALEGSGFGDSRNLAAQFYLHNMRVFKVMFTAIIVAMVLVFVSSRLGLLQFGDIWVPHTFIWPGILGGLLLGVGFIVGGYCPGTSMVATSTLKLDGLFFVLGMMGGMAIFHDVANSFLMFYQKFYESSGVAGRVTLMDWTGLSTGILVTAVIIIAVLGFVGATWCERTFKGPEEEQS